MKLVSLSPRLCTESYDDLQRAVLYGRIFSRCLSVLYLGRRGGHGMEIVFSPSISANSPRPGPAQFSPVPLFKSALSQRGRPRLLLFILLHDPSRFRDILL